MFCRVPYLDYSAAPSSATTSASTAVSITAESTTTTETVEMDLEIPEPDPEALLAERRRKRAEILAKYSKGATETGSRADTPEVGTPVEVGTPKAVDRVIQRLKDGSG